MNTHIASASAAAHGSRTGSTLGALWSALGRIPLAANVLPIAGAFVCSLLLYARLGGGAVFGWDAVAGVVAFIVLFVVLRFIDDLDDLERDHPAGDCSVAIRSALRTRLLASLAACIALIALCNIAKPNALPMAGAAATLGFAAPFVFKRLFPQSLGVGFFVFEGVPLAIFAYAYGFFRDAGGAELASVTVLCVTGLFWAGYEFWKFSRKVHTAAMQPYFLSPRGIRAGLTGFLVLALVLNVALAHYAGLSRAYAIYAAVLPLAFLAWLNTTWRSVRCAPRQPLWAGMTFVIGVELGLFVELLPTLGSN